MRHPVIVQLWEESERGWGVRPDGFSIHRTEADRVAYVNGYLTRQRALLGEATPDEYTRPAGDPYIFDVDDEKNTALSDKNGVMFYESWSQVRVRSTVSEAPSGAGPVVTQE